MKRHRQTKREQIRNEVSDPGENKHQLDLRDLRGKVSFHKGYDYKKLRGTGH